MVFKKQKTGPSFFSQSPKVPRFWRSRAQQKPLHVFRQNEQPLFFEVRQTITQKISTPLACTRQRAMAQNKKT